ncbi:MAG: hypothetical protein HKN67_02380 [Saprospiraceae bacterium]|nr:hypothetical protein [Bacteroidia bacterium]MBT8230265.1 hypothetical protein [Bacteroidia bacterium]NNF20761.1 hypothetical protein [Saprospiraceae bacterium]
MDFRTEWSSWLLLVLMVVMAVFINPYNIPSNSSFGEIIIYVLQILAYPFFAVTIASIPVVIICWMIKVIPDIDYSIRVGFVMMLILLAGYYFT